VGQENYPLWRPVDLEKSPNQYAANPYMTRGIQRVRQMLGIDIAKAADSTVLSPLIRQDLDPTIYKLFVKRFPLFDLIEKIPANGLVHAFNQKTGFGDALFQTELGTVTDDASTYVRATQNIAVLATRRGVSLKAMFAVGAGGMGYDPESEEIEGGLQALRHKTQVAMCRMQNTNAAANTATAPDGLYDSNAFNGMRYVLNNTAPAANTFQVDETAAPSGTPVTIALRKAANAIMDVGGNPDLVLGSVTALEYLEAEQIAQVRFTNQSGVEIIPGVRVKEISAGDSLLPLLRVPGDSMGSYIVTGPKTMIDLMVLDTSAIKWAYLGGATPTVLEIPIATDGKLQQLYIPFLMGGLVQAAPLWMARVQIRIL